MTEKLPTAEEIGAWGPGLDEESAVESLLGKTRDQVVQKLRTTLPFYVAEDLGAAGPVAFEYYLPAFTEYLTNHWGEGEEMTLSSTLAAVYEQFSAAGHSYAVEQVRHLARAVLHNYERFEADEALWGPLRRAYEELLGDIEKEQAGEPVDWAARRSWWQKQKGNC